MPYTDYHHLRATLSEELRDQPDHAIEAALERRGINADLAEDFLQGLARIGSQVLPIAGSALGMLGGPFGSAIGGALGSAAGQALGQVAGGSLRPQQPPRVAAPPPVAAPPRPAGPAPSPAPPVGSAGASAELLRLLSQPGVLQSLFSSALGNLGAPTTTIGSTAVPVSAIANAIGQLGQVAAAQAARPGDQAPRYWESAGVEVDEANPMSRADAVLQLVELDERARQAELNEYYDGYDFTSGEWADDGYLYEGEDGFAPARAFEEYPE